MKANWSIELRGQNLRINKTNNLTNLLSLLVYPLDFVICSCICIFIQKVRVCYHATNGLYGITD